MDEKPTAPVLVVDDDDDIRGIVAMMLEAVGYSVETAEDGATALGRLAEGLRPSVILLDMMMPRMDGEAFLAALRARRELADLPVVLLSGHNEARRKAEELHVSGCLVKPVDIEELVDTVADAASHATPP